MTATHNTGERLLARWESLPGELRWVADVGPDEAEAWLAAQMYAVADAAALAGRLEPRMLAAVGEPHVSGDSPEAHLHVEFAAARCFLEGRASAVLHLVSGALSGLWERARLDASDVFDQLGLLLEGGTIDALQYLLNAILFRSGETKPATVDAAGYRARRRASLDAIALRAAERAQLGERVVLDPMTAVERKVVHERLKDVEGVQTTSEGAEPNRSVVVLPRDPDAV